MTNKGLQPAAKAAMVQAMQNILNDRDLDVWVEVRDSATGEAFYSFLGGSRVSNGDEVTVTHRIGDVRI